MYKFIFTKKAKYDFLSLDNKVQGRVKKKLESLKKVNNITDYLKIVYNLQPATHRLRIGNYRLLLKYENQQIIIYKIGHMSQVYK